jgi:hypothetical protein
MTAECKIKGLEAVKCHSNIIIEKGTFGYQWQEEKHPKIFLNFLFKKMNLVES